MSNTTREQSSQNGADGLERDSNNNAQGTDPNSPQFTTDLQNDTNNLQNVQPTIPSSTHIVATINGQEIGRIYLNYNADLAYILNPPTTTLHLPTTLVLNANQSQIVPNNVSSLQALIQGDESSKRPLAVADTVSTNKKKKRKTVAVNAGPIPKKPASKYAKAAEELSGMTKNADDTCLTCIKNGRNCKGTDLFLVNGRKRCGICANPGRGTSGRICYWKIPGREDYTYEVAQHELAKTFGGRKLQKNTRPFRIERQQIKASRMNQESSTENDEDVSDAGFDGIEESEYDGDFNTKVTEGLGGFDSTEDDIDGELLSAVQSAMHSLYEVLVQDLGLSHDSNSTSTRSAVSQAMCDAMTGSGPHQDRIQGIDVRILNGILTLINNDIEFLEEVVATQQLDDKAG